MKHSLSDLNSYLFDQLDRLSNDDLSEDQIRAEIERSDAVSKIACTIIQNATTQLKAVELFAEYSENGAEKLRKSTAVLIGEGD